MTRVEGLYLGRKEYILSGLVQTYLIFLIAVVQPTAVYLPGESAWTEEPGGLQSIGSQKVEHEWATKPSTTHTMATPWTAAYQAPPAMGFSRQECWSGVPLPSHPFICWWTSRLLPCLGYYKQCCDEHWGTRVSFNYDFLGVYAQQIGRASCRERV